MFKKTDKQRFYIYVFFFFLIRNIPSSPKARFNCITNRRLFDYSIFITIIIIIIIIIKTIIIIIINVITIIIIIIIITIIAILLRLRL